jgi:hypothetical protein
MNEICDNGLDRRMRGTRMECRARTALCRRNGASPSTRGTSMDCPHACFQLRGQSMAASPSTGTARRVAVYAYMLGASLYMRTCTARRRICVHARRVAVYAYMLGASPYMRTCAARRRTPSTGTAHRLRLVQRPTSGVLMSSDKDGGLSDEAVLVLLKLCSTY